MASVKLHPQIEDDPGVLWAYTPAGWHGARGRWFWSVYLPHENKRGFYRDPKLGVNIVVRHSGYEDNKWACVWEIAQLIGEPAAKLAVQIRLGAFETRADGAVKAIKTGQ